MSQWPYNKIQTIFLMLPLVALYSFSLDLYLPLLPQVAHDFAATKTAMQASNSVFMLICGLGQLCFGPISDYFGRKPVLICALVIYAIGGLISATTTVLNTFILVRILQALGACGAYLCCFASIRDLYHDEDESAAMFSFLNIANSISAVSAPSIGALIGNRYSWHSIFFLLAAISTTSGMIAWRQYQETTSNATRAHARHVHRLLSRYKLVCTDLGYHVYTLPAALGIASFFAYYCISPYLYQETMGVSPLHYGELYGSCGLVFLMGSFCCGKTVTHIGIQRTLWVGLTLHCTGSLGLIIGYCMLGNNLLAIHSAVLLIIFGASYMIGSGIGGTMAPFQDIAGIAFSLISAYKFMFAEILGDIVMHFYNNTPISLAVSLFIVNLVAMSLLYTFGDGCKRTHRAHTTQ